MLPARYLTRNPYLPLASAVHDVAEAGDAIAVFRRSPPEPWRVLNAERLAAEGDRRMPRSETAATGFVTSAGRSDGLSRRPPIPMLSRQPVHWRGGRQPGPPATDAARTA